MLDGVKLFAADAAMATHLIVAVRAGDPAGEVGLWLVEAGGRA